MRKLILATSVGLALNATTAFAAPITPENLIGRYRATAKVLFKKYTADLRVLANNEFEVREVSSNGTLGEVCNGTFVITGTNIFSGKASCPSDRNDEARFTMNLGNAQIEDLDRGAQVMIATDKTGSMKIKATVIRY